MGENNQTKTDKIKSSMSEAKASYIKLKLFLLEILDEKSPSSQGVEFSFHSVMARGELAQKGSLRVRRERRSFLL